MADWVEDARAEGQTHGGQRGWGECVWCVQRAVGEKPHVLGGPQDEGQVRGQVKNHWTSVVHPGLFLVRLKSGWSVPGLSLMLS